MRRIENYSEELIKKFQDDVIEGLLSEPKCIPSRYLYNKEGDRLFQEIMQLPEYYLTRCEYEILETQKEALMLKFVKDNYDFDIIELGAGDGYKTRILLEYVNSKIPDFTYYPVDISENSLLKLNHNLSSEITGLNIVPVADDYLNALNFIPENGRKKIVLFLGSSIGNFRKDETIKFLSEIGKRMNRHDLLLIGFDLKKDPRMILKAYKDRLGITDKFQLNILHRMRNELKADVDISLFEYFPEYNPVSGEVNSYIFSKKDTEIYLPFRDAKIKLNAYEPIHTEVSRKFSLQEITELAKVCGFNVSGNFLDGKQYFADSLWEKK
ncbi:MAG: L-histidine N(alpha)-methyltransferase [Cytophagaceae bacterium]